MSSSSTHGGARFRWRRLLRPLIIVSISAVVAVVLLWGAIHRVPWLGPALADGARAVVGPAPVAWMEDFAYGLQDRYNRWRHGDDAPTTYWEVAAQAPSASHALPTSPAGVATNGSVGGEAPLLHVPLGPPPPATPMFPIVSAPGDGKWLEVERTRDGSTHPLMYKTMLHPDRERPYTALAVVAMDLSRLRIHAVPGTTEPSDPSLPYKKRPGTIPAKDIDRLVAAFNGGFQTVHGGYGMMVNGERILKPKDESCTIAIYRDGSLRIRPWAEIAAQESDMIAYRQTPDCLIDRGVRHADLENAYHGHWGAVVGRGTVIRRSAMGISADGRRLFFGMGDALTARSIADGMKAAGAHDVAQLDVNHVFPRFVFFGKKKGSEKLVAVAPLCPGFTYGAKDYVTTPMVRDFFYVTRHDPPKPVGYAVGK